jgi:ribosomal protein L11 methylase PrmA
MRILTIFLSSVNKYGVKFLFFIFLYEILNIYRFRFNDYLVINPTNKSYEPSVPTPYYCLSLIEKNILKKKYNFIDFGCGKGRVINYVKQIQNIQKIIGIENNLRLKKKLKKYIDNKTKIYIDDCTNNNFLNFLIKKQEGKNLILYFYHPFSDKILNTILKKFLIKNRNEVIIIIMGEIFVHKSLKKKFKLKQTKLHNLLNIYNYKHH